MEFGAIKTRYVKTHIEKTTMDYSTYNLEPKQLLGLYKKLLQKQPDFCAQIPYLYAHTELEKKYCNSLINICRKNKFSWPFRTVLFNLLAGNSEQLNQVANQEDILKITDLAFYFSRRL